ncbi:hypothetical protein NpNSSI1_00009107 [Neofusicoccum parvum]|nr:hypothetical protein NpNSSI1_00009107 [Neofusicoccum parvum]
MPRTTRASTKKLRQPKASRKKAPPSTKPSSADVPSSLHKTPAQAATATTTAADNTAAVAAADTAPTTTTTVAATILTLLRPAAALLADLSAQLEAALAAIAEGAASEADAVEEGLAGFVKRVGELDGVHGEVAGLLEEVGRGCGWDLGELAGEREGWKYVVEGVVGCVSGWGEGVSEGEDEEEEWVGEGEEDEDEGDEWLEDEEWGGKGKGKRKRGKGKDNGKKKRGFGEEDEQVVKKRKTEGSAGKGGKKGNDNGDAVAAQVEGVKEEAPEKVVANEEPRQQKRDSIDEFEIDWDI